MATNLTIESVTRDDAFPANFDSEPLQILRAQAEALSRRDAGLLDWYVKEHLIPHPIDPDDCQSPDASSVSASLLARIANGSDFTFSMIDIFCPFAPVESRSLYPIQAYYPSSKWEDIADSQRFRKWLADTLSSPQVRDIIARMLRYGATQAHLGNP